MAEDDDSGQINATGMGGTEVHGFAAESLVPCPECSRANSPLRSTCIYCGNALPSGTGSVEPDQITLRPPADWERAFNLIVSPRAGEVQPVNAVANFLRQAVEEIQPILEAGMPLPIVRTSTKTEADLVARGLSDRGLPTNVIADDELTPVDAGLRLIRALEFGPDVLTMRTSGANEPVVIPWSEVATLVTGRFRIRRTEINEKKGKRQEQELMDVRELTSDEPVLDVYARDGQAGRITANGFNFSCLGIKKTYTTTQNFSLLVEELRRLAPAAVYDDSYAAIRRALELAWPLVQRNESLGWKRLGLGKVSTDAAVVTDNEQQFSRYSRLRFLVNGSGLGVDR